MIDIFNLFCKEMVVIISCEMSPTCMWGSFQDNSKLMILGMYNVSYMDESFHDLGFWGLLIFQRKSSSEKHPQNPKFRHHNHLIP